VIRAAQLRGQHLVVAVEQGGDAALGDGDAACAQDRVDLRHGAVIAVAQGAHQRHDVEPELVARQRQGPFGLGSVGLVIAGAALSLAAADLQAQPHRAGQRRQGAAVLVADPHTAATSRAEAARSTRSRSGVRAWVLAIARLPLPSKARG
jgi:hypothetical protein